jgi:hypothetical protein
MGEKDFRLCGQAALRAPYCEACREEYKPFRPIDPDLNRAFFAGVLRAAER